MREGGFDESENRVLTEMFGIFEQRSSSYKSLRVSIAAYNPQINMPGSEWRNILTRFQFTSVKNLSSRTVDVEKDRSYDYGEFVVKDFYVAAEKFQALAEDVILHGKVGMVKDDLGSIRVEGSFSRDLGINSNLRPSNDQMYRMGWPVNSFKIEPSPTLRQSPPGNTLVTVGLPLYEYGSHAISEVLGIDTQIANQSYGQVVFLLPNFTAKIDRVKLDSQSILLNFEIGRDNIQFGDLVFKMYCHSAREQQSKQFEFILQSSELIVPLDFTPDIYTMYILTKEGEILDFRRINLGWPTDSDIQIEPTSENLEQLIVRGESELVEFKQEFPRNNAEFAESVVAMANTSGGRIIVGVDDHGSPVGIQNPKAEETIRDILRNYCEPSINPEISRQEILGKSIIVILVNEGKDKPYVVKNKGPYVRFGSTDRMATRDEIIRLCNLQNGAFRDPLRPFG